ncbi:hypothetical protein [uncultured Ruegeria sp.]|uniref:hypothetical protein n=1 Tax=uncultured Ruegeria sp. TaxID=259304 RepID=UPI0026382AC5|nr:hypothetical protein [uncultured Ruegeria sp.]
MRHQLFGWIFVAAVFTCLSLQIASAQQLVTLNSDGQSMSVSEFASHTWIATSSERGRTHSADLKFDIRNDKLVGKTIHWPNSGKTSKLAVESLTSKRLVVATVVEQECGKSRKITYEITFKKKNIRLKVSGPKSRCRSGTFNETGKLTKR